MPLCIDFISCHFAEVLYGLQLFGDRVFGFSTESIMSSAKSEKIQEGRGSEGEADSPPSREPDAGLDPGALGS